MKTFIICNSKGGVGKTTVSLLLAMTFARSNMPVAVLDLDNVQRSSLKRGKDLGLVVATHAADLPEVQYLVVDTPPHLTNSMLKVACESVRSEQDGRIVLVMPPTMLDFEATLPALQELGLASNPSARLLYNKVATQSHFGRRRDSFGAALPELQQLPTFLTRRSCYERAMVDGLAALSKDARNELDAVVMQLLGT